jgi:hypothetical protein
MFVVTEADAAAIRATFNQEGELSAAIELRRPAVSGDHPEAHEPTRASARSARQDNGQGRGQCDEALGQMPQGKHDFD